MYRMTTRRDLIVEKYCALELELSQYFESHLFPSLQDIDLADMVTYITILFIGVQSDDEYKENIRGLMKNNSITVTDEVFEKVAPLVTAFVRWLKEI